MSEQATSINVKSLNHFAKELTALLHKYKIGITGTNATPIDIYKLVYEPHDSDTTRKIRINHDKEEFDFI